MAKFSLGLHTPNTTANRAQLEIFTSATKPAKILEISVDTIGEFGVGRPAAVGVTPTGISLLPWDPAQPTPATQVATAWGTSPTVPAAYHYRDQVNDGASAPPNGRLVFSFPDGLIIPAGGSVVLWSIGSSTSGVDVNVTIEE